MKRFVIALGLDEQETAVKSLYVGDDAEKAIAAVDKELSGKSKYVKGIAFRHVGKGIFHKRSALPDKPRPEVLTPQQLAERREIEQKAAQRLAAAETLKEVSDEELEAYGLQRADSTEEPPGPDADPQQPSGVGDSPEGADSSPGDADPVEDNQKKDTPPEDGDALPE